MAAASSDHYKMIYCTMKKIFRISAIVVAALTLFGATGCKHSELDTDQYAGTSLADYGPNPVMRGGTLTFYGSGLESVTEVIFPDGISVTSIEVVKSGNPSEIRVAVPQGAAVGKVQLVTSGGTTLTTKSNLEYSEPIVLESFSPTSVIRGDVLTISGDYMNLVEYVEFANGERVAVESGATRTECQVVIPYNAVTGTIILVSYNGGSIANLIYSTDELSVEDPTVKSLVVETAQPGETAVIKGAYLDMIETVNFGGVTFTAMEDDEVSFNEDYTEMYIVIPSEAVAGDVVCTSYDGDEFTAGEYTPDVPTNISVAPEGDIKAGETVTISGDDLQLVTGVSVEGAGDVDFTYNDDGTITFTMPEKASDGNVTFTMANGDTVTASYTVVKPVITAVTPTEVVAGNTITITGTDLDLVGKVELNGTEIEITRQSETEIVATTTALCSTGTVVVTAKNGTDTSESSETVTITYDSAVIIDNMPASVAAGSTMTMTGSGFNLIEAIYFGDVKVTSYSQRADGTYTFVVPAEVTAGTYNIKMVLTTGEEITWGVPITVTAEMKVTTIWSGSTQLTWNDGGRVIIPASKFEGVGAGAVLRVYYTQVDQQWDQAQFNYGDWSGINFDDASNGATTFNQTLVPTDVYGWFTDGILDRCTEMNLTQTILDNIQAKKGDCEDVTNAGVIIQGSGLTFTKVEIVEQVAVNFVTIWEGTADSNGDYGTNLELGGEDDWVNNGLEEGATVYVYFTTTADAADWSMQTFDGHWSGLTVAPDGTNHFDSTTNPTAIEDGYVTFTVTSSVYSALTSKQYWGYALILQGYYTTFTKIAFVNP